MWEKKWELKWVRRLAIVKGRARECAKASGFGSALVYEMERVNL